MTLDPITHPSLPFRHGFFTRKGGASSGVFKGLNCGQSSSDQREAVVLNRTRVAHSLKVAPDHLIGLHQIHSANVVTVTDAAAPRPQGDALVTATPGIALSVLTADCQPVLFADPDAGVIGAAHGGWQGTLDGVLEATVAAMRALGARAIRAVIGPTISRCAYEVGPEFYDRLVQKDPASERHFAPDEQGRLHFDLPAYGLARLALADVRAEWTGHCTYADPGRFFSYRRSTHRKEADYGRLISAIVL